MPRGEQFLHKKYPELHTTSPVEREKKHIKRKEEKVLQKPAEKIEAWLKVLEKTHGHHDDPRVLERIKKSYHKDHVIKPDQVPENYFKNQQRLAREQGHGDIEIGEEQREHLAEVIIADQESTLDKWVDYLASQNSTFPIWAKYWAFKNMVKLSTFDKEKHAFAKRRKDTVAPFPDLNREALAYVIDAVVKKTNKEDILEQADNEEFQKILKGENFGKLYVWAIEKVTPTEESEFVQTKGEWVKYDQNSDYMPLVESLQGHGTGWCTAGESTAEAQLKAGDFYAYYSFDKTNKPTIPRVAIRMQDDQIAEVRGVAPEQNIDPHINEVVDKKLKEFPDGEKYKKKTADMKHLTRIGKRYKAGKELTKEDLRFLYEFDAPIKGFGYEKDPRIEEIISTRNIRSDISAVTGYLPEQISTTKEDVLKGNSKYHYGNLDLQSLTSAEGLKLPKTIRGHLDIRGIASAEGLKLPESIGGGLFLSRLTSAEGLELPKTISGSLDLQNLESAEGLTFPKEIGGSLYLHSLESAEGLTFPKEIGGTLDLRGIASAEGLKLPDSIGDGLYLNSLTSAEGLNFPKIIGGNLDLQSLTSAERLKFPDSIGGYLEVKNLTSTKKDLLRKRYPKITIF